MRRHPAALRRETERHGYIERLEGLHLAIEPLLRVRTMTVRPAQAGPKMPDTKILQPAHGAVEAWVLEMKPLADAERRRQVGKPPKRALGCAVFTQQAHVEMT